VQTATAASAGLFSSARAYAGIVEARTADLRSGSVEGLTGIFTFLDRRFRPAMATVAAAQERLQSITAQTGRAADLLRTRVGITAEA
jgi:uncharacterized membrane-anchored protein